VLTSLRALSAGAPAGILYEASLAAGAAPIREIVRRSRLAADAADLALDGLLQDGRLILLEDGKPTTDSDQLVMSTRDWVAVSEEIDGLVGAYHIRFPLRGGIPREELKNQLGLPARTFNRITALKARDGQLVERRHSLALPGHEIQFGTTQRAQIESLLRRFDDTPYAPPSAKECREAVGEEIIVALKELGQLVAVSEEVIFKKSHYDTMVTAIQDALANNSTITLAEVRDLFHTSRKYAQALLEHLDSIGMTRRNGDTRVLAA
jgi:selenocysteine-specific elongation factor